jgi:phosphomannomutase
MSQPLSLKIGSSGVRGIVGESLTPQLVASFAAAFGTYCGMGPILVGTDRRPSGEMITQAIVAGLLGVGCTPVDVGVAPLPSLMLHVREAGAFGGISVGGGDAPPEWSALRFVGTGGLPLRANQSAELTDVYHQGVYPRVRALDMSEVRSDTTTLERHVRAVVAGVDAERIRRRHFKVALDATGGSASVLAPHLLAQLGCESVPADAHADVGFGQDEDGDRLTVKDERGTALGAAAALALLVRHRLGRRPGPVVVDVATSRMIDDVAAAVGCAVHRSPVGEPNLLEAMAEHVAELGGESDGGIVVLPINPCRDSFAAMALFLEAMAGTDVTVGALRNTLPRYAMVTERLLCAARDVAPSLRLIKSIFRGERFDLTDGVKVTWADRWLLARPSATEPVIRLAAEAPEEAEARALVNRVLEVLSPGA